MNKITFILLFVSFAFTTLTQAQYGPGGVGDNTNLHLWLKSDGLGFSDGDLVDFWEDSSENNNPAFQNLLGNRPTFESSVSGLNGLPGIFFSGGNDNLTSSFLKVADDLAFDNNISQIDLYAFVRPTNIGSPPVQGIISKRVNFNTPGDYAFTLFLNNQVLTADINAYESGRLSAGVSSLSNNKFFLNSSFNGSGSVNDQRHQLYSNSVLLDNRDPGSFEITRSASDITIGVLNEGYSQYFAGYIPELIFFNSSLNQTQRKIVDNYIAAKFDINITPNKLYDLGDFTNGNYDFNVIGIGQESSGDNHINSKGSGIIRVNNPNDLNDGEYLFIGSNLLDDSQLDLENGIDCNSNSADDIDSKAIWRVGKYGGDIGAVDISFDTSSMGLDPNNAELVVSSSSDFSSPSVVALSSVSGSEVIFSGVNFTHSDFIKLRFKDVQPVIWNGSNWANGSGTSSAPNLQDFSRKLIIDGTTSVALSEDASCFCAKVTSGSDLSLGTNKLDVKKQFINNGNLNGSNGTLEFSGDLKKSVFGQSFEVANLITHADIDINIDPDNTLDINTLLDVRGGSLDADGSINLTCNFISGITAQVGPVGTDGAIVGNVTVEQCFPARRAFRLIASSVSTPTTSIRNNWQDNPISYTDVPRPDPDSMNPNTSGYGTHITGVSPGAANATLDQDGDNGFDYNPSGNASMFTYDNIAQDWNPVANTTDNLIAGTPYRLMIRGDRSINIEQNNTSPTNTRLSATGTLIVGSYTPTTLLFTNVDNDFNFIANPYHAQVDIRELINNSLNLKDMEYYVWDPTLNTRGGYATVDLNTNNSPAGDANVYLQPMQAAFVRTGASGSAPVVNFEESHKDISQAQTTTKSLSQPEYINIQLYNADSYTEGNTPSDGLRINFDKSFSATSEDDSPKLGNLDENLARIEGNTYSAIERRPFPETEERLELFINQFRREAYVMKFNLTDNLNTKVFIEDKYLNETQEITTAAYTYTFTVDESISESTASDRFSLVFEPISLSTVEEALVEASLYPNPTKGSFRISGANLGEDAKIEIYNMIGQQVYKTNLKNQSTTEITNFNGSAGVYLVKLKTNQGERTFKLIKQ